MSSSNKKVAMIGSGLIGRSWGILFASAGYSVTLYDISQVQIDTALHEIKLMLTDLEKKGVLKGSLTAAEQFKLITGVTELGPWLGEQLYIQESIPEVIQLKRDLYENLDQFLSDKTILASSTSTFLPSVLSEGLLHKSQFIVAHPVNPPYFVPLVELVPAPWTEPWVLENTKEIISGLGQAPVVLKKEIGGFALNRIQYAILNECWNLVNDGVISVEDIDKVMSEGLGTRYAFLGPFETAHLNAEGFKNYVERYGDKIFEVSSTFNDVPRFIGPQVNNVDEQLSSFSPMDKLAERRKWRDESLTKLYQLKKSNNF